MIKKLITTFVFIFLFLKTSIIYAEEISQYQVNIFINKQGTINVEEEIAYDFGSLNRYGIYRTLPFVKENNQGKKYHLDYTNFSVVDNHGQPYPFQKLKEGEKIKLKIGDPQKTITGLHHYIISYQVSGALTYFSDHDELYWNAIGTEWSVLIKKAKVEVFLPAEINKKDIKIACYKGKFGMRELCQGQVVKNSVSFRSGNLKPNEGLTIVVGFPKNQVAVLEPKVAVSEPKESVSFWKRWSVTLIAILLSLLALFWYVILPFSIIYRWFRYGRDPRAKIGRVKAWYDPPKTYDGKRFLTPAEVGLLGDEKVDLKDVSATIVDLARRGYLKIEERKKNDFWLVNQYKFISESKEPTSQSDIDSKDLVSFEKLLLILFFKNKNKKEICLKKENLHNRVQRIKEAIYKEAVNQKLFPENPNAIREDYLTLALLGFFTLNLQLLIISIIFGLSMPRKTIEGVNAKNIAFSLRNFLKSQERQLTFQADQKMMFERLLPYAIVFGVEKIWAKRFADLELPPPDWYQGYGTTYFNTNTFVNNLNSSLSSFQTAASSTRSTSGFSSGFSGGFSGGGGGGGGGGSW